MPYPPSRRPAPARRVAASLLLPFLLVLLTVAGPAPAHAAGPAGVPASLGTCQTTTIAAPYRVDGPTGGRIAGTLCTPRSWAPGARAIDVLVHGGMYDRQYWDWQVRPEAYSYVRRTLAAGRATFHYDRYGAGASSRPISLQASFDADIAALHHLIGQFRRTYAKVTTIGHSLGSVIVVHEAARHQDVDRVVVTGLTHGHGLGFLLLPTAVGPALLDPEFAGKIGVLDGVYLTTLPGAREWLFYAGRYDRDVVAHDEATKAAMSEMQAVGAITALTIPPPLNEATRITAPVLVVVGQLDQPFCNVDVNCSSDGTVLAAEAPYYTGARSLTVRTVPDTGHNLPLHPTAGTSFKVIDDWIRRN